MKLKGMPGGGRKLLEIRAIPHDEHRYRGLIGDWTVRKDGSIGVAVSDLGNPLYELLVGLHEAVEAVLCRERCIEEKDVCAFDEEFYRKHKSSEEEPGEDPASPYFREHAVADVVERLVAFEVGAKWVEYGAAVDELLSTFEKVGKKGR